MIAMFDPIESIKPKDWSVEESLIKVIGVGGGGCNAVTYMYNQNVKGCTFVICNTDMQSLSGSDVPVKIKIGEGRLGAGCDPEKGRRAAIEAQDEIAKIVLDSGTQMLFITAGMGGGTGTGAAPVIAKMAKDRGILTIAVVTLPFKNEGSDYRARAVDGIRDLQKNVDSLLVINNEKLYEYYGDLLIQDAFPKADEVLATAVRGIVEIISQPGYINVDFEDVRTMMRDSGVALMGCGTGSGPNRIDDAIKQVFESPLLNNFDLTSAKNVLVNITAGRNEKGMNMNQLNELNQKIKEYTGGANSFKRGLIWDPDPEVGDSIRITAIATGLKFTEALDGEDMNLGHYIVIDSNFVYEKPVHGDNDEEEGISLPENFGTSTVLGLAKENQALSAFNDTKGIPVLVTGPSDKLFELENISAIRRAGRQN